MAHERLHARVQGHPSKMLGCIALLLAGANTQLINDDGRTAPQWAEVQGQPTTAELIRQHAVPPKPAAAAPAAPPVSSLPIEILKSAGRGELQKVVKWLGNGGLADALISVSTDDGCPSCSRTPTVALLHATATGGQLEMARELLERGASVDLPGSDGITALMEAAYHGHLSIVLVLLQHSANPDLQNHHGYTAMANAAYQGHEACVKALLRAKANTELLDEDGHTPLQHAEAKGHMATAELIRQHVAPQQQTATSPAAPLDAGESAVMSSPASLPFEIYNSANRGQLQKVARWLRKGGTVDELCPVRTEDGRTTTSALLHAAVTGGQLEMVRELLERGASVDLPSGLGRTAFMEAAHRGHLPILRFLLQRSTNPNLQDSDGSTTLMHAAYKGQEACVQALLHANANPELLDNKGRTALRYSEAGGLKVIADLIWKHAYLILGGGGALCTALPLA